MSASILQGKVALVTGASRGIGRSIALRLGQQGARVAICARGKEAVRRVADELQEQGITNLARTADVAVADQVEEFVKSTVAELGGIDILVNNAGVTRDNLLMRMSESDWTTVLDTNLKGAFNCCKAVVRPMLKARRGRIINVSSVVGLMGNPGQVNYAASKAGLIGLTKSLARELASRSITVNVVAPGLIPETGMTEEITDEAHARLVEQVPLGRPGTTDDVASAVAFLASEQSAYITGQVLQVDGGLAM